VNGSLVVVDDVAASFAQLVADRAAAKTTSQFALAFSGGSTARECYAHLARFGTSAIDWSTFDAWWGDERCVPLTDADSNYRLVEESLLSKVPALASVQPMRSDIPNAADVYDRLVRSVPPIDIIHLGLGPDGHTASLFPQSEALTAPAERLVVSNVDPLAHNPHERLTFTFGGIARCRSAVVTVAGASKTEALHRVLDGDLTAPATHLVNADLIWLVDPEALGSRTAR
jgi:6-phosphogluconolactonase